MHSRRIYVSCFDRCGLRGKSPARPALNAFYSVYPSTRTFVPCFLQTPPRGGSPCIITSPFLYQDGQRTRTSKLLNMPSTRRSRPAADASREVEQHWLLDGLV